MANKSPIELSRVSINLPTKLVCKVKNYALENGYNVTTAYIVLLNYSLEVYDEKRKNMG